RKNAALALKIRIGVISNMQLDFRRPPLYHFKKQIRRLRVIEQIKNDVKKDDADKYGYKNVVMNQFFIVQLVALWQAHIEYLVTFHFDDPLNRYPQLKSTFSNKKEYKKALNSFGTPGENGINRLIDRVFNITEIMSEVRAGELSNHDTLQTLKEILKCRHEVAHTGRCYSVKLDDQLIRDYRAFILNLADSFDSEIYSKLYSSEGIQTV
ncbi:HEPN domain-containing protein, partial [Vibrio splendidus]